MSAPVGCGECACSDAARAAEAATVTLVEWLSDSTDYWVEWTFGHPGSGIAGLVREVRSEFPDRPDVIALTERVAAALGVDPGAVS